MALTLIEYAKTETDQLKKGVIETFASTNPILEQLPFKDIEGNAYKYNQESALPGIAFRGVNEAYDEGTGVLLPKTESLKIMGGDADTDKFLIKTERSLEDRRASDIAMKVKAASLYFTKIFFDGDEGSTPKEPDGLNQRLTGNQVITAGTNGAAISHALLQQCIDAVDGTPDALLMGKKFRRQLFNLAESSTILSEAKDAFGRTIKTYADIPIRIIEKDNSDNVILAFDETQGNSDVTASCYAVKYGVDEYICGIQSDPLDAYDLGEIDTKPVLRARIEWYMGIAMFHPRCAARLKGVTASVS